MASTTPQYVTQDRESGESSLQELAKRHLWMHFTRMSAYDDADVPILVKGDGCYVYDEHGKRYLDGLAALFCVNAGHGRTEIGEAMAEQVKELGFFTNWSYAHPPAIELAARIAGLAPEGMDRVFFTSGGSEAVESAMKMCRAWHRMNGEGQRIKVIAREIAYHGTTLGALSATGITDLRTQFEPLTPGGCHVAEHQHLPLARGPRPAVAGRRSWRSGSSSRARRRSSAVIMEPVQNAGGAFVPPEGYWQRVREICDKYGVLLISDEVICSWGRLGEYFGCERYDYMPDLITTAKGLTSAYAPMGAVIAHDQRGRAVHEGQGHVRPRPHLRRAPGGGRGRAREPRHLRARGPVRPRAREGGRVQGAARLAAATSRSSATCAAPASSTRSSWSRTSETKEGFSDEESETLLRGFLSGALYEQRPDLPRRRPRRPRDPAVAAAGGRHRAVRGDRRASCASVLTEACREDGARA